MWATWNCWQVGHSALEEGLPCQPPEGRKKYPSAEAVPQFAGAQDQPLGTQGPWGKQRSKATACNDFWSCACSWLSFVSGFVFLPKIAHKSEHHSVMLTVTAWGFCQITAGPVTWGWSSLSYKSVFFSMNEHHSRALKCTRGSQENGRGGFWQVVSPRHLRFGWGNCEMTRSP